MNIKKYIIVINLIGVLFYFGKAVIEKETLLQEGELVLLELAPADPRSLMQGDYMDLRYAISQNLHLYKDVLETDTLEENRFSIRRLDEELPKRGALVIQLDSVGVGEGVRIYSESTPLKKGELVIRYFKPNWRLNIGAESYFFQEGEGEKFEEAKYGGLRIDAEGNSVLVGLYDKDRVLIE